MASFLAWSSSGVQGAAITHSGRERKRSRCERKAVCSLWGVLSLGRAQRRVPVGQPPLEGLLLCGAGTLLLLPVLCALRPRREVGPSCGVPCGEAVGLQAAMLTAHGARGSGLRAVTADFRLWVWGCGVG